MAIDVHQCPRCELRFTNSAELRDHFGHDHQADPDTFDRYRYRRPLEAEPSRSGPRHLVVGNQTLHGEHLESALRERAQAPGSSFYVLVPATHSAELRRPPAGSAPRGPEDGVADDAGLALARWRLRTTIDRLHGLGIEAEGQVGHPDPFTAITRVLGERHFDEIVLSTLPQSLSRWLEIDLPGRLRRRFHLPVVTIAADEVVRT
jgi:hypothetical protein